MSSLQDGSLQDRQRAYLELQRRLGKAAPPRLNIVPFPPAFPPIVVAAPCPVAAAPVVDGKAARYAKLIRELQAEVDSLSARLEALVVEDQSPLVLPSRIKPIVSAVASYYGMTVRDIVCMRRTREYARPRQVVMYLSKKLTSHTFITIGRVINRDHSTVITGARLIAKLRETDPKLDREIQELTALLTPKAANV